MNSINEEFDPLFDDVVNYIATKEYISIDEIKEHFNIGYNRSVRLLEQMEEMELVAWEIYGDPSRYKVILSLIKEMPKRVVKNPPQKPEVINVERSDKREIDNDFFEWMLGGVTVIIIMAVLYSCSGRSPAPKTDYCSDGEIAYVYAKKLISTHLKAPSTAKFASYYDIKPFQPNKCKFNFIGYVDAQNSFGAMIRTQFDATVRYDPNKDKYYLEHLKM